MLQGSYKEVKGDLIDLYEKGHFDVIVHGCNCQNLMGMGIAKALAEKYPELMIADKEFPIPIQDYQRLGNYSKITHMNTQTNRLCWILNAYTQYNPGKDLCYLALEMVLKKINFTYRPERIGIPGLIGGGLAGGKHNIIRKIIKKHLKNCDVTVVFLPQNEHLMLEEFK